MRSDVAVASGYLCPRLTYSAIPIVFSAPFFGHFHVFAFDETNGWISCKFRRVDCRRGCGATVVAHQREVHEQEHCRLSKHPCVFGCGEKLVKAEMDAHIKKASECLFMDVVCSDCESISIAS